MIIKITKEYDLDNETDMYRYIYVTDRLRVPLR
jgi:hypothetical protein